MTPTDPKTSRFAGAEPSGEAPRIESYLRGNTAVFREIDEWIRIELRHRYPGLRGEHEDLAQVVHARLLSNLRAGRFERRSALRTYVTGIVHHTAIDRTREIRRQRNLLVAFAREPRAAPQAPGRTAPRAEAGLLRRVILGLPQGCRELWRMVYVERLAYDAIAERLSIPVGTVKSRMWHCRRKAMAVVRRLRREQR